MQSFTRRIHIPYYGFPLYLLIPTVRNPAVLLRTVADTKWHLQTIMICFRALGVLSLKQVALTQVNSLSDTPPQQQLFVSPTLRHCSLPHLTSHNREVSEEVW